MLSIIYKFILKTLKTHLINFVYPDFLKMFSWEYYVCRMHFSIYYKNPKNTIGRLLY